MAQGLRQLIEPVVVALDYELWHLELAGGGDNTLLRLYIDHADGITLDDCARVSREVSAVLDVEDPLKQRYRLEVSSPGLDRPLVTLAHFRRFIGEKIRVNLYAPVDGKRKFMGVLTDVNDDELRVNCTGDVVNLRLSDIAKSRLAAD